MLRLFIIAVTTIGIGVLALLGFSHYQLKLVDEEPKLTYFTFSDETHTLRCIEQGGSAGFENLEEALIANSCIAGSNGGFFHHDNNQAVGLLIDNGKSSGDPSRKSSITSATLYAEKGQLHISRSKTFNQRKAPLPTNALQTGPFLIENGKVVVGNLNPLSTARTFIATNGKGHWLLGYADNETMGDLAKTLSNPKNLAGFRVHTAINLDGGPSSALWINDGKRQLYMKEAQTVANYLGIAPIQP